MSHRYRASGKIKLMRTRIKICGITRHCDAELVANSGADALGMIFHPKSPRNIELTKATEIVASLPPFLTRVAVVVNPELSLLEKLKFQVKVDRIQYHGDETPALCESVLMPYYKALTMRPDTDPVTEFAQYPSANAVLLDTYLAGHEGGTGKTFDWQRIDDSIRARLILAGGLSPENIYQAILQVRPYAVDVNSGVETKPGIKDALMINELIIAVSEADQKLHQQTKAK